MINSKPYAQGLEAPLPPASLRPLSRAKPPPTLNDVAGPLKRLEGEYRDFEASGDHDPEAVLKFLSDFVTAQQKVLKHFGLTISALPSLLIDVLEHLKQGTKHPLVQENAPVRPRWKRRNLIRVQAEAAVILERARDRCEPQKHWAKKIADHLGAVGIGRGRWGGQPAGPCTPDVIIKWRVACINGQHPASGLFRVLLEHTRKHEMDPASLLQLLEGEALPRIEGE